MGMFTCYNRPLDNIIECSLYQAKKKMLCCPHPTKI